MKSKWPKFLTLKRMVFITLVLVVGIVLATYFLGGYKGISVEHNTRDFSLDGFMTYSDLLKNAEEEAEKAPYNDSDSLETKVKKCNYKSQLQTVINEINQAIAAGKDYEELLKVANERLNTIPANKEAYINEVLLGYGTEPLMSNGDYDFYFNKKTTTFKVIEKKTGNIWYSNPTQEETFTSSNAVKRQQQSLVNIYYTNSLGGTTLWDSYTYAISDTNTSGDEALTPNFQIKEVKDASGNVTAIQVYYYLKAREISYTAFPKSIDALRLNSLADINYEDDSTYPELFLRNKNAVTNGTWEVIGSIADASISAGVELSDDSMWHAGTGAPDDSDGSVGSYYVDTATNKIYVKAEEIKRGKVIEYWEEILTKSRTWKDYLLSNATFNNLSEGTQVFEYAYTGEGAPVEGEGINGFYYLDTTTNQIYKKVFDTNPESENYGIPYTHSLAAKEITYWTSEWYRMQEADWDSNTFGINYMKYSTGAFEGMGTIVRKRLYTYFYDKCLYTEQDLIADNKQFNEETVLNKGEFGVAMEYALTDEGLSVTLLDESLYELEEFPIVTIDILPYFTVAHYETDGYAVIPDGSGAIMNYNNGKTSYVQYSKAVYSTDLTKMEEIKQTETEDLMLSMFAMVNTNIPGNDGIKSGVLVDATSGSSQLRLNASISKITDSYNRVYFSAFCRESQKTTIGLGWSQTTYTKWTEERNHNDITINYHFLEQDELSYSAIAKRYREILIDRFGINSEDTTDTTVLNVSLVGAYDFRNNFLGIGYRDYDAMTTFEEAEEILSDLKAHGANHINAYYLGWRKKGLIDESFKSIKINSELGNKKDLESLTAYAKSNDIDLYMDVNFGEVNKFQESYGKSRYSSRDVTGEYVEKYPYMLAQGVYDEKQNASYVVSPRFYQTFMNNLVDGYYDGLGLTNLSIKNLGSSLASDYKRHQELFKETSLNETIKALEYAKSNGIENVTLYNPYDFAFKYTTNALEVPYASTQYEVLDYSIPFYQLIVNGLFDYSGQVINANDEKGSQWHIMHILETGSNAAFTFSFEDSSKLIQTDYKYYYYTQYSKWVDDVREIVDVIDEIGIHGCELMSHEMLANSVYKVTYSGNDEIEIILNYSDAPVVVNGMTITAKSYVYSKNNAEWRG